MKKTTTYLSILFLAFQTISCQSESEKAWETTMKVHDEVMVKMQENGPLESKYNELIKRAEVADTNSILYSKLDTLRFTLNILSISDEEMMDWMAAIQSPNTYQGDTDYLEYLNQEKENIIIVGEHMDLARTQAENLLISLEK